MDNSSIQANEVVAIPAAPVLPAKHMFSVREVAEILTVEHKTVRAMIAKGDIKHVRLGRLVRIPRSEVLRLIGE